MVDTQRARRPATGRRLRFSRTRSDHGAISITIDLMDDNWNRGEKMWRAPPKPIGWMVPDSKWKEWEAAVSSKADTWATTTTTTHIVEDLQDLLHFGTRCPRGLQYKRTSEVERRLRAQADDIRTTPERRVQIWQDLHKEKNRISREKQDSFYSQVL